MNVPNSSNSQGKHVVVLGCGNIGSQAVGLVASLPNVTRMTLVDFDRYEDKNRNSQSVTRAEFGRHKARVQAGRALRINPELAVEPIVDRLENVPLGLLRADVILAGLDSKESRRCANETAWRLGVPWIDAGIEASQMLARVNVYLPGPNQPCLECGWSERDYAELATIHPCDTDSVKTPATNAPACLGALAAALQVIECQKILDGHADTGLVGRQVVIDAATHRHYVTAFRRNPRCRFDHARWNIHPLGQKPKDVTIGSILRCNEHNRAGTVLSFGNNVLVRKLDCPRCGWSRRTFRLLQRIPEKELRCDHCGTLMLAAGFHAKTRLSRSDLGPGDADRSFYSLGLRANDVIRLRNGHREKFFQL